MAAAGRACHVPECAEGVVAQGVCRAKQPQARGRALAAPHAQRREPDGLAGVEGRVEGAASRGVAHVARCECGSCCNVHVAVRLLARAAAHSDQRHEQAYHRARQSRIGCCRHVSDYVGAGAGMFSPRGARTDHDARRVRQRHDPKLLNAGAGAGAGAGAAPLLGLSGLPRLALCRAAGRAEVQAQERQH